MGEHDSDQRIRLVVLGGGGAGKTSVIKRFLFNTFEEKYRSTVEDLYYREYDLGSMTIKVDILDTAGDFQFPAMRRLSIATANAFLLIYALDSADSLEAVKMCVEEIREHRPDFPSIPMLVVGNKNDLPGPQVKKEDVAEWVYCELPRMRVKLSECSAKSSANVRDVFRGFLQLARFPPQLDGGATGEGLKRRSSEYGNTARPSSAQPPSDTLERRPSPSPRRGSRAQCEESFGPMEAPPTTQNRLKPRSRSLIRRSSKKTSKLGAHTNAGTPDDCSPS